MQHSTDALRIRDACDAEDFTRLKYARLQGWKDNEILEYARICFHRPGKDYATPGSIRKALEAIRTHNFALAWRKGFRKRGSIVSPPRSGAIVDHKIKPGGLTPFHRYWPYHSCHVVAKVNAMVRERLKLPPDAPIPVNTWNMCHYEYFDNQRRQKLYVQKKRRKAVQAKAKAEKDTKKAERAKARAEQDALFTPEQREQALRRREEQKKKRKEAKIARENLEFERGREVYQRAFQRILGSRPEAKVAAA